MSDGGGSDTKATKLRQAVRDEAPGIAKKKTSRSLQNQSSKVWTPIDDMTLIDGILSYTKLRKLSHSTLFSIRFTPAELRDRWYALLYDQEVADASIHAISGFQFAMQPTTCHDKEEEIAAAMPDMHNGLMGFQALLDNYNPYFNLPRSGHFIESHYSKKKAGRNGQAESVASTRSSRSSKNNPQVAYQEPTLPNYTLKHPISHHQSSAFLPLELSTCPIVPPHHYMLPLPESNLLAPSSSNMAPLPTFFTPQEIYMQQFKWHKMPPGCLAGLFGKVIHHPVGLEDLIIGRLILGVDGVNLTCEEGNAAKISRQQAIVSFNQETRQFHLKNIGRARVKVNHIELPKEGEIILQPTSILHVR